MEEQSKAADITHPVVARLAQLILASRPFAKPLCARITLPVLIGLAVIEWAGLPPLVHWSSKPRIVPNTREAKAIPVEVDQPTTLLLARFAMAPCAELASVWNGPAGAVILGVEVSSPGRVFVQRILACAREPPFFFNALIAVFLELLEVFLNKGLELIDIIMPVDSLLPKLLVAHVLATRADIGPFLLTSIL
jgi:hypothetical protein